MAEATKSLSVSKTQDKIFRNLLVDLKGHLNTTSLFSSFKMMMKSVLSDAELNTEDFLQICLALERHGHISPSNMKILKEATKKLDITAYKKITIAEKKIRHQGLLRVKVTMHVEPPNRERELKDAVLKFYTQQIKLIPEGTDFDTRQTKMEKINKDFKEFVQTFNQFGAALDHMEENSLIFVFSYHSQAALKRLWELYASKELLVMLTNVFFTTSILELCHVTSLSLEVYISEREYECCLKNAEDLSDSEVLEVFYAPVDKESKVASRASKGILHFDSDHSQEQSAQTESIYQELKDSKEEVMSSIANTQHAKVTIQDFVNKTENTLLPEFHGNVKNLDDEISRNTSHYINVIAKIKKQNKHLKLKLDEITNKMISLCKECEKQNEDIIKNHKTELQSKINELNGQLRELKNILQTGTDTQICGSIKDIPNYPTIPALPSLQDMDFKPTSILIDQLENSFGELISNDFTEGKSYRAVNQPRLDVFHQYDDDNKKRSLLNTFTKETSIVVPKFKMLNAFNLPKCTLRIKAASEKNIIWVKDTGKKLSKLTKTGRIQKEMKIEANIQDFCVSSSTGDIWFCSRDDNSIRKVTTDNTSTLMFHTDSEPLSICISADGNILVGLIQQIVKYTQCGQILCKSTQVKQVPVVRYPWSISPCPVTGKIAVVDRDGTEYGGDDRRHVSVFSGDLQLLCRYYGRDTQLFCPEDMCYSETGDIYIADNQKSSIEQINDRGEFIQTLYTDHDKAATIFCVQSNGDIWAVFGWKHVRILQKQ